MSPYDISNLLGISLRIFGGFCAFGSLKEEFLGLGLKNVGIFALTGRHGIEQRAAITTANDLIM